MRSGLNKIKKNLVRNMHGNTICANDLNDYFRLYAKQDRDIYIPPHLRGYTNTSHVQVSGVRLSIADYLMILKVVRRAFVPIKENFDNRRRHALKAAKKVDKDDLAAGTQFGDENYRHALSTPLDTLYKRVITPEVIDRKRQNIRESIDDIPSIYEIAELVSLLSYFFDHKQQIEKFFSPYMDKKLDI